jgi:hypothetical protein
MAFDTSSVTYYHIYDARLELQVSGHYQENASLDVNFTKKLFIGGKEKILLVG